MTLSVKSKENVAIELTSDLKYTILEYVSDQLQIRRVSKNFLLDCGIESKYDFFNIIRKQYRSQSWLPRPLNKQLVKLGPFEGVLTVCLAVIQDAKRILGLDGYQQAHEGAMVKYQSELSPYRLQDLTHLTTLRKAQDTIKVFSKIAESVPTARDFLQGMPADIDLIQKAERIRNWMNEGQHRLELGSVLELNLAGQGLSSIPDEVRFLRNLQILNLQNNQLRELTLPDTLTALRGLDVSNNQLTKFEIPRTCTQLQFVSAKDNQLTEMIIPENLVNLQGLDFTDNRLERFVIPGILPQLQKLGLSQNRLRTFIIPIDFLPELRELYLVQNQIREFAIRGNLPHLEKLNLSTNKLERLILPDLNALQVLAVDHNQLTEFKIPRTCTQLRQVFSNDNQLTEMIIPETLVNLQSLNFINNRLERFVIPGILPQLQSLCLSQNRLRTFIIPIDLLPELKELYLAQNQIREFSILGNLPRLQKLILSDNQLERLILPDLNELVVLAADHNKLTEFEIRPGTLTALKLLGLNDNQLTKFAIPATSTELQEFFIARNQLTEFEFPRTCTKLQNVVLACNKLNKLLN